MNRLAILIAACMTLVAILVGYLIVPGRLEQVTMLTRDGQYETALAQLEAFIALPEENPELYMQGFELQNRYGDPERGEALLQTYFELRPDDIDAWRRAADAFSRRHQPRQLVNALEHVVRLSGDGAAASELAHRYRLESRFDDELRIYRSLPPVALPAEDRMRYASLLIAVGEDAAAVPVLEALDAQGEALGQAARHMLFAAETRIGAHDKAAALATHWLEEGDDLHAYVTQAGYLARAGARHALTAMATHPRVIADPKALGAMADFLASNGRQDVLAELIAMAIGHAVDLDPERADQFVRQVVATSLYRGLAPEAMRSLAQALHEDSAPALVASFMQALFDHAGYAALAPFRTMFSPRILEQRPVLAAQMFMMERNVLAARGFLLATDLRTVTTDERLQWLELAIRLLPEEQFVGELSARARAGALPQDMAPAVLKVASHFGRQDRMRELWAALLADAGAVVASAQTVATR